MVNHWHIGKKCEMETLPPGDEGARVKSVFYEGTESGYHTHVVEIVLGEDGHIYLEDDENFVYLYPEQVEHLKKFLATNSPTS